MKKSKKSWAKKKTMNKKLFLNLGCRRPNKSILLADFPDFTTIKERGIGAYLHTPN
jgi:hypothetical protein